MTKMTNTVTVTNKDDADNNAEIRIVKVIFCIFKIGNPCTDFFCIFCIICFCKVSTSLMFERDESG